MIVKLRHEPDLVITATVEINHGRPIVEVRPDNGWDDPFNLTPREARSLARKLSIVADQADRRRDARTRLRRKR